MMSFDVPCIEVANVDRIEISAEPRSWEFATVHRAEIDQHFAHLQRQRSAVWNGRVLLLDRYAIRDGVLHGGCFETDYASFIAWRDWDFPDQTVCNVFAAAALQAADGAYLIGEMAPYTAAAGQQYFPSGTPEPSDLDASGLLNLTTNLRRELREETGIEISELDAGPSWTLVRDRCFVALIRRLVAREEAHDLRRRIMRHLASEQQPELSDIRIVRGPAELDPRMPRFVSAFLQDVWGQ